MLFKGEDTLEKFGSWLFNESHTNFTVIAHNMEYDGIFLSNYLLHHGFTPKIIYSGTQIMSIDVQKGLNMRIIDSMNFIQTALCNFPKTFGLDNIMLVNTLILNIII